MTRCRSDCPQGDCANCTGLGPARPVARCVPTACAQQSNCLRASMAPDSRTHDIDASGCKTPSGWCPVFIDARGAALLAEVA